jgi:alpha-mannosidase
MNAFRSGDQSTIPAARKLAEAVLGASWEKQGADVYKKGPKTAKVWGIGHCHIDTAWLWPYSVTQQKVARSWATQVDLMERYPEHRFAASSAQQYKWLEQVRPPPAKKSYPRSQANSSCTLSCSTGSRRRSTTGGSISSAVRGSRMTATCRPARHSSGSSSTDSASSRAGQFNSFRYRDHTEGSSSFGKRCETGWLPDSFGLTGAYPQLMRLAGMKYFFTQKLSWNNM